MTDAIIKVGGSLQKGHNLTDLCLMLENIGKKHRIILIPGGGLFADSVRRCTRDFNIDQNTAHWMAILAMNQYGYLLSSLIPDSVTTEDIDEAQHCAEQYQPAIFLPYRLLKQKDPLPHSWQITSDSISAWIAGYLDTKRLILIKSRDMPENKKTGNVAKRPLNLGNLTQTDIVDPMFCSIMNKVSADLWIINGNDPKQLTGLFETDSIDD